MSKPPTDKERAEYLIETLRVSLSHIKQAASTASAALIAILEEGLWSDPRPDQDLGRQVGGFDQVEKFLTDFPPDGVGTNLPFCRQHLSYEAILLLDRFIKHRHKEKESRDESVDEEVAYLIGMREEFLAVYRHRTSPVACKEYDRWERIYAHKMLREMIIGGHEKPTFGQYTAEYNDQDKKPKKLPVRTITLRVNGEEKQLRTKLEQSAVDIIVQERLNGSNIATISSRSKTSRYLVKKTCEDLDI